ncbi:MAG: hypothetical protein WC863_04150 [Patescibacteria group bacterium]
MKKFAFLFLFCFVLIFFLATASQSKIKSYYSGDAVNFNGRLYIGSTNSDSLELFKLEGRSLSPILKIKPFNERFGTYGKFYDLKFSVEAGRLFVYAVSEYTLYKYEVFEDNQIALIKSDKNTYWEWYSRVDKFGSDLVTVSNKGVKVWNKDLQVINAYEISDSVSSYNLRAYNSENILDVQDNHLLVFDRSQRTNILSIPVNYKKNPGNRQAYQDDNGDLFIVDDYYTKKFDLAGDLVASFKHADYPGYDISSSGVNNYIYFSNGAGLVKLNKTNLKEVTYRWTTSLGGPAGWAMGLKVVDVNGDKVVLFNGSNILVLDENLRKITAVEVSEMIEEVSSLENLYLNLDHNFGAPSNMITLSGGGYLPHEQLKINFSGTSSQARADYRGRFSQKLVVPDLAPGVVDIKVTAENSKLSYSTTFQIIK